MTFTRLQTSQARLYIQWQKAPDANSYGVEDLADAIEMMTRRGDGKPILINRETEARDPKVKKLYDEALKSERFSLASQWFYCAKVGDEVLQENHPLHELFSDRNPPALVLLSPDGRKRVSFLGTASQRVKWAPIADVLGTAYEKNPTTAVKALEKLLCDFDAIDGKQNELDAQMKRATENKDERKIAAIKAKLAEVEQERQAAFAEEAKLRDIGLRSAEN